MNTFRTVIILISKQILGNIIDTVTDFWNMSLVLPSLAKLVMLCGTQGEPGRVGPAGSPGTRGPGGNIGLPGMTGPQGEAGREVNYTMPLYLVPETGLSNVS